MMILLKGRRRFTGRVIQSRSAIALWLLASLAIGLAAAAVAQSLPGNPLAGLDQLKEFQAKRVSSSDPDWKNGNADARPLNPGQTLTLAELEGPGMIAHLWCTMAHRDPAARA